MNEWLCPTCHQRGDLESRLARLEEEKAQAEQMLQEGKDLVCEGTALLETTQQRLARAEAAAAAMRARAEQIAQCEWYGKTVENWREGASHSDAHDACHAALDILRAGDAALSSPVGRDER